MPLGLLFFKQGLLADRLQGLQVVLAVEGARHFRTPSGLGELPFQGAEIVKFSGDVGSAVMGRELRGPASRAEDVAGLQVLVFQEKLEEDVWTVYIAFPTADTIIAATDGDYLKQTLARISGDREPELCLTACPSGNT